ncbi:hypothetical protein MKW94_010716 [Papaver nudicaule]|uniref:RanBD1 domain-containing protein n=1 Tax=Papaver nudicaule TaxID=74823 RepID=A0AA41W194_PAPNU|nr:hypothetical protein [Papaver nudicaule]
MAFRWSFTNYTEKIEFGKAGTTPREGPLKFSAVLAERKPPPTIIIPQGEEEEDVLLRLQAKLYRFDRDGKQWKERGVGFMKLLKHKQTGKARLVMRQSKARKVCANHYVLPTMSIHRYVASDRSWVWHATDFSDGELKQEMFFARFASTEDAEQFGKMVVEAAESQVQVPKKSEEKSSKEGGITSTSLAAQLTDRFSLGEKKDASTPWLSRFF